MIAQAFFTGVVVTRLELKQTDSEGQYLQVLLRVKKGKRKEMFFYFDIWNGDALHFKQKVAQGDLVAITAEPLSSYDKDKEKNKYKHSYKIILFEVLKKKEME